MTACFASKTPRHRGAAYVRRICGISLVFTANQIATSTQGAKFALNEPPLLALCPVSRCMAPVDPSFDAWADSRNWSAKIV